MTAVGTFAEPLASIEEPCPNCGATLRHSEHVSPLEFVLSRFLLTPEENAQFEARTLVWCDDCDFRGTACR